MFSRIRNRIALVFRGSRFRKELDEEMAFHVQCLTEDLIRGGMEPKQARREAIMSFGSREGVQARSREVQGMAILDETVRNLRFAFRGMARSPLFSSTFILTLALCIGLGTAVFSVVDAVLWRPLPYPRPDQLGHAVLYDPGFGKSPGNTSVDGRSWERLRDEAGMVDRAVYSGWVRGVNLSTDAAAAYVDQQRVGAGYYHTLGVLPQVGREFRAAEDVSGGSPVAILSHGLWRRAFGEDPEILGSTIRLKGESHTVVGIMPPGFRSPAEADVWTPLRASTTGEGGGANYAILVRIPPEMSVEEADARLAAIQPPTSTREDAPEYRFGLVSLDEAQTAALGLTALATLLFGLAPVLQVRKPGMMWALLSGSRGVVGKGGHLMRKTLLVGEVTMVTALLFAAGLLVRSYGHLEGLKPGFDPQGVLTVQFSLDDARYAEAENIQLLFRESLAKLREIPGVASASVALTLPYERPLNLPFRLPGDDEQTTVRVANAVYVTPGFFETLGVPLLQGRVLHEGDRAGAPFVAVANQAFVEEHFQEQTAMGTPVRMGFGGGEGVEIVGVVGNVLQRAAWGDGSTPVWETPTLYLASAQASDGFMRQIHVWFSPSWMVRGAASQPELAAQVTRAFRVVDAELPVARMAPLQEVMDEAFARERFEAAFLLVVAGFALLLAGIGLYGIVAHEVLERRAEMGLRMALGATPGQTVWTTGLSGVLLTFMGLLLGGALAVPVGRVMVGLVYGVTPFDPLTMGMLVGVLALFSTVASFVPAARIGRTDPAEILREG